MLKLQGALDGDVPQTLPGITHSGTEGHGGPLSCALNTEASFNVLSVGTKTTLSHTGGSSEAQHKG